MIKNNQNQIVRYFNPTSDWGFKRLFGSEFNKDLLIGLLNRIIPDEEIEDLEYLNGELLLPIIKTDNTSLNIRKSIVDVYCSCKGDKHILVEMQNYAGKAFFDRAIVYTAASIVNNYNCSIHNRYKVNKTIFIAITGDSVFPEIKEAPVQIGLCCLNKKDAVLVSDKVLQIFVELSKFADSVSQLTPESSFLDRFAVAMKSMASDTCEPEELNDEFLSRIYCAADIKHLPRPESENYITSLMTEIEYQATLYDYLERGEQEGMAKAKAEVAKKFKEAGQSLELIAQCTGLSIQEIEKM